MSGKLIKQTSYTGFSGSAAQQTGYFIPFLYNGDDELKYNVKGKQVVADKAPTVNVAMLGQDKQTAQAATLNFYVDGKTANIAMNDIEFEEQS